MNHAKKFQVLNQADIMFFLVNLPESRFLTKQTIDRTIFELGDPMQRVRLAAPVSSADLQLDLVYSLHVGAPRHVRTSIFGVRLDDVENAQWLYHRNMQYVSCSPCQCKGLPEGVTAVLSLHQVKR